MPEAEARYAELVLAFGDRPGVTEGVAFASPGLRINNKIFVMLVNGELVFKLPEARCAELIRITGGRPFGSRRPMREWVSLGDAGAVDLPAVAEEALAFVDPLAPARTRRRSRSGS